jgi:hypothetical protein
VIISSRKFLFWIWAVVTMAALPGASFGLIVYDAANRTDNTFNTTAPSNGAPWVNVAQQQRTGSIVIDSGAVYIGNGFILTANHTNGPTAVILEGIAYQVESSFPSIAFTPTDLRLYKIKNPPALPLIPLPDSSDIDTSKASTLVGWGKGKGSQIPGQGWTWGGTLLDDDTKAKRWGTNTTTSAIETLAYWGTYSYAALLMDFNITGGVNEATAAMSDSGGGVFQKFGSTWKLSGILTAAPYDGTNYPNGNSFYNPSYQTYAVQLKPLASKFRYRQWKQAKGIAEATLPENDTDGDGLGILEEYAFGLDPAVPSVTGRPTVGMDGSDLALIYQLERTRTDITLEVEESSDLITWDPAPVSSTTTVSDNGSIRTYKAKVPQNGAEKKFLRLKLTALTN